MPTPEDTVIREQDAVPPELLPASAPFGPEPNAVLDRLAGVVRQILGVPVALVSFVGRTGQVNPGAAGLPMPFAATRCVPLTHSLCKHVVASAAPLVVPDLAADPALAANLAVTEVGVRAYAGIPLTDLDGSVVGSLCALDLEPRDWTAAELALLTDIAAACSAELQLRSAAAVAEQTRRRSDALLVFAETLSETVTLRDVSAAVAALARDHLGASFGGLTLLDEARAHLAYVDRAALPESFEPAYAHFPVTAATPSADVARTGEPVLLGEVTSFVAAYPESGGAVTAGGASAGAYYPLALGGRPLGVLTLLWDSPRGFDAGDRALFAALGRYAAQAVNRATLLADRRQVAETLQAAMLPTLPELPWLELAGRYRAARVSDAVGGDWFDAFALPDGDGPPRVAVTVGDVEGHDTEAAAVMGQLRSMLRGLTVAVAGDPAQVLTALDDVLAALPPERYATGVLATVSPAADGGAALRWANAGHPPPLLIVPGEAPELLVSGAQLPLGLPVRGLRSTHARTLPAGSTVLLFTDGLVERRGVDTDAVTAQLSAAADRHRAEPLPALIDAILAELVVARHGDDIVLFGVRLPGR